jgi:hypothetical protein
MDLMTCPVRCNRAAAVWFAVESGIAERFSVNPLGTTSAVISS